MMLKKLFCFALMFSVPTGMLLSCDQEPPGNDGSDGGMDDDGSNTTGIPDDDGGNTTSAPSDPDPVTKTFKCQIECRDSEGLLVAGGTVDVPGTSAADAQDACSSSLQFSSFQEEAQMACPDGTSDPQCASCFE